MAAESSFDIVSQFDQQELTNALDQVRREISTRYDFKGVHAEVILNAEDITLLVPDTMKLKAVVDLIYQKLINRKLSPNILEEKPHEPAMGGTIRQVFKLVKALDQESCKTISKLLKEKFPKVKPTIQGTAVRVSSKSKDDLQAVIAHLSKESGVKVPLQFTNYR